MNVFVATTRRGISRGISPTLNGSQLSRRGISRCIILKNLPLTLPDTFESDLSKPGKVKFNQVKLGNGSLAVVEFETVYQAISAFEELDGSYVDQRRVFAEFDEEDKQVYNKGNTDPSKDRNNNRDVEGFMKAGGVKKSNLGDGMWGDYKGKSVNNDVRAHFKYVENLMVEGNVGMGYGQKGGWKKGPNPKRGKPGPSDG